jgi:hypothetical protein
MKNLRNKFAPPTADLVQRFIDSAYDNVKLVADNLEEILELAEALGDGTIADWITEAEAQALIDGAVEGLYEHKGGWNASTNTPDLTTGAAIPIATGDAYVVTVAGMFFTAPVEAGDLMIANSDDPVDETGWTLVNRNIDASAFATAAQGLLADSALQSSDVGSAAYQDTSAFATSLQGTKADTALQPGDIDTLAELNAILGDADLGDAGDFATQAQGALADSALQPEDVGSAAFEDVGSFATAAQGASADTALQEEDINTLAELNAIVADVILGDVTKYLGQNLQTGTTYTLVLADAGKLLQMTNAAANEVTVPPNSTVAFPIDTRIDIIQGGAGETSIIAGAGVTLRGDVLAAGQWKALSLWKRATNEWVVIGGTA